MINFFLLFLSLDSKSNDFLFLDMLSRECGLFKSSASNLWLDWTFSSFPFLLPDQHMEGCGGLHVSQSIKRSLSPTLPYFSPWWYGDNSVVIELGILGGEAPTSMGDSSIWCRHCGWSNLWCGPACQPRSEKALFSFLLLASPSG